MSHCLTTATATYTLQKYSRSYPNTGQTSSNEWQHFTNPLIRLVLDVQKSASNQLESVRLRIIWSLEGGPGPNSTNEVVFEDLDLLSFSSIPFRNRLERQQPEGLPLKAVYRDTIVGIRYLHPLDGNTYRRFQVTFASSPAVAQFIQSIETICPCKANNNNPVPAAPAPPPSGQVQTQTHGSFATPSPMKPPPIHPEMPPPNIPAMNRHLSRTQTMLSSNPSFFVAANTQPTGSGLPGYSLPATHSFMGQNPSFQHPYQPALQTIESRIAPSSHALPEQATLPVHTSVSSQMPSSTPQSQPEPMLAPQWSSLPPSSNPSSAPLPDADHPVSSQTIAPSTHSRDPSASASVSAPTDPLLASLREGTRLYELPSARLESLVAEVVREEGFVNLMENLSTMWRVKGYLGH
ncbi:hypothetical protein PM082_018953 [Marasmius tenuissimus]|nr:hypothetical protein PM082_018953 [Marasmius tenuissimus]